MENAPLINDPKREAVASMRGYSSQVWRSVLTWLRLSPSDRMYLEGAEDIDVVQGLDAETIQVKATHSSITFRTPDVVDTIENFYSHLQRNPGRNIRLRFLTTSSFGVEQGTPFGPNTPGLEVWERARQTADSAARDVETTNLKTFLVGDKKLSPPLKEFLQTATNDIIWGTLISRIEWDSDSRESRELIEEIRRELVLLGHSKGVAAQECEKVAPHLYEKAWSVATQPQDRFLELSDAIGVFDKATQVTIPQVLFNDLVRTLPAQPLGGENSRSLRVASGGRISTIGRPHVLPERHFQRQDVIKELEKKQTKSVAMSLYGTTGTGKSTLAAEYVRRRGAVCGWVDLRGIHERQLADLLTTVAGEFDDEKGINLLVLDDMEMPEDPRILEVPLGNLASIARNRRAGLIVTSNAFLSQRLALAVQLQPDAALPAPPFSRDEIQSFLISRGCPAGGLAEQWAAVIYLHTLGHPQLVHARVAVIEMSSFQAPTQTDFLKTPADVIEARVEARRLFEQLEPAPFELLCRLSLSTMVMDRRQVISIASQGQPISNPGLALDRLVGPWVEQLSSDIYRISPLAANAGTEIRGQDWAKGAHRDFARGLLLCRSLTPWDISFILLHGLAGEDWNAIAQLSIGLVHADKEAWNEIATAADWFNFLGVGEGVSSPATSQANLFAIRLLQYQLACAKKNTDQALAVIDRFDIDIPADHSKPQIQLFRHFFSGIVLARTEIVLSITQLVRLGAEHIQLSDEIDSEVGRVRNTIDEVVLMGPDGKFDFAAVAGFALLTRVVDRGSLTDLLDFSSTLDPEIVRRLLWLPGGRDAVAWSVSTRVWIGELAQAQPDWHALLALFKRLYEFGRKFGLMGFAAAGARSVARVLDEKLSLPTEALRVSSEMALEIGWSTLQEDGRAHILYGNNDVAGALEIWRVVLPRWDINEEFDIQRSSSCREAGIAAARMNLWLEASDWFALAHNPSQKEPNQIYEVALSVDEGYARWMGKDNRGALQRFNEALTEIDKLPDDDKSEHAYLLRKRTGHVLMWVSACTNGAEPKGYSAPPPGVCSGLIPYSGPRVASTPSDSMWAQLLEFESRACLGSDLLHAHRERLLNSDYGLVRHQIDKVEYFARLRELDTIGAVKFAARMAKTLDLCRIYYGPAKLEAHDKLPDDVEHSSTNSSSSELIFPILIGFVLAQAARGAITTELMDAWHSDAVEASLSDELVSWLQLMRRLFVIKDLNPLVAFRDESRSFMGRCLASIAVSVDRSSRPSELLNVHAFWGIQLIQVQRALFPSSDVERLVADAWIRLATFGAFLLRSPMASVPAILQACNSNSAGWRKIGEILLAAESGTPAILPEGFHERFVELSNSDGN